MASLSEAFGKVLPAGSIQGTNVGVAFKDNAEVLLRVEWIRNNRSELDDIMRTQVGKPMTNVELIEFTQKLKELSVGLSVKKLLEKDFRSGGKNLISSRTTRKSYVGEIMEIALICLPLLDLNKQTRLLKRYVPMKLGT